MDVKIVSRQINKFNYSIPLMGVILDEKYFLHIVVS